MSQSMLSFLNTSHLSNTPNGITRGHYKKSNSISTYKLLLKTPQFPPPPIAAAPPPHHSQKPPNSTMFKNTIPSNLLLVLSFAAVLIQSQSIIPSKYDGFVYKKPAASTATVMIEAFYDPVCPDSRDSWAPLKKAVDHYGGAAVSLIVHTFPLPLVFISFFYFLSLNCSSCFCSSMAVACF